MIFPAILMLLQAVPTAPADPKPAEWPDPERESAMGDTRISEFDGVAARKTMALYAACVAESSADKVSAVLVRDFRTTEYRNGLKNLSSANEGCARKVGLRNSDRLRMGNLPFAAALAEVMIASDPEPLKSRLAKAAAGKTTETFAPRDAVAMCVVRSVPDDVTALLQSEPGTEAEASTEAKLLPVARMCADGTRVEATTLGLRSIIATATFRLLAAQEG